MRTSGAAFLALALAGPAIAQTPATPNITDINDVQVYNKQAKKLGEASKVLVNGAGNVEGVIVRVTEAGSPQREVVVPLGRVKGTAGNKKIVVAATTDELKAMPKPQDAAPSTRAGRE